MNGDFENSAAIYEQGFYSYLSCPRHLRLLITWTVVAADPENDDAKKNLAEVYEILGETRKTLNQGERRTTRSVD